MIENIKTKYGYQWKDFAKIIHITDTDGAFTKDCIRKSECDNIRYYTDHIECSDVEKVEKRNKHKFEVMYKLYSTGKIRDICYRIYFNSCNLEHVLYNELKDFSDEEKEELSDKEIAVSGGYRETWKYIEKNQNSLIECRK